VKARLLGFIDTLRAAGVSVTVAETIDATRAVSAVGVQPSKFREALAATLIKDEGDRPVFDEVFARFFRIPLRTRGKGEPQARSEEGEGRGAGRSRSLSSRRDESENRRAPGTGHALKEHRSTLQRPDTRDAAGQRLAHERALKMMPFYEMSARQIEECDILVKELAARFRAHLARRLRRARRGRLDVRRTIRRSMSNGGVPIDLEFRRRRPGRPSLIVLCDYSYSVVTASNFLLALLGPVHVFFRRVRLFAFVDRPVEISIEDKKLVPHGDLDLYARSDFGNVLRAFWERHDALLTRSTLLLILGDGRNNRRPPRADVLARIYHRVRQIVWLNPESSERWNSGDSVMRNYECHCDALLAASNVTTLHKALSHAFHKI